MEKAGHDLLVHWESARSKDGGLDPGILSHLLANMRIETLPDYLIESLQLADLQAFVDRIRREMASRAFPNS